MAKVFLGVGHGGSDPGAVANGLREKDVNLGVALACRDELARNGVEVRMSRMRDENDPLTEEIRECNAYGPDLALDIHHNAGGGDGIEVYCHIGGGVSRALAENIIAEAVAIGQNSRGAKTRAGAGGKDYYGFIRETRCPAAIAEGAFLDNAADAQFVATSAKQAALGIAYAKGILKTLGIAHNQQPTPTPTPQPSGGTYTVVKGDTLSEIGARVGVKWQDIAAINGISAPYTIYPGQVLQLAGSAAPAPAPQPSAYLSNPGYRGSSIADALAQIGVDNSYSYRARRKRHRGLFWHGCPEHPHAPAAARGPAA